MRCRYKIGNTWMNERRGRPRREQAGDMSEDRLSSYMGHESLPLVVIFEQSYSVVSVTGVVCSLERIVLLVSCTRLLSLFTGLVLVGEMERP